MLFIAWLQARKISNPGCYATGSQMALMPLLTTSARSSISSRGGSGCGTSSSTAVRWDAGQVR